ARNSRHQPAHPPKKPLSHSVARDPTTTGGRLSSGVGRRTAGKRRTMNTTTNHGYAIVNPDDVDDSYADSDVPGEFRRLTHALDGDQLAVTLIRVPAHCDFEQ